MNSLFVASYAILWVVVLVEALAIFAIYHHFAELYLVSREGRASQGPAIGKQLPPLLATSQTGSPQTLPRKRQPTLLVFTSTTCKICERLKEDLGRFAGRRRDVDLCVLCAGTENEVKSWSSTLPDVIGVFPDRGYKLAASLSIGLTPFVVGLDDEGVVRVRGLVNEEFGLDWATEEIATHAIRVASGGAK